MEIFLVLVAFGLVGLGAFLEAKFGGKVKADLAAVKADVEALKVKASAAVHSVLPQ
jgi:hypothetical protein